MRLLQPEVLRYHGSFSYHYILGAVCLRVGEFGSALTYLRLAREINGRDPRAILGLAALYLRRGDTERAVDLYLEALEIDPGSRAAKSAMGMIRRRAGTDGFAEWLEAGRLRSLYPPIPFPGISAKAAAAAFGAAAAACAVAFGAMVHAGLAPNPLRPLGPRELPYGLALTWAERAAPLSPGGEGRHALDRGQAIEAYERALALFSSHRDEAARISLNRILDSNASEGIKNRARLMMGFLETPGFDTFRRDDNVSHAQAWQDPRLHSGVHVIWRGIASNVSIADRETSFDLLLGYDSPRIVEGVVSVAFPHAVPVPEGALEVLGRIEPAEGEGRLRLEGLAIRINL